VPSGAWRIRGAPSPHRLAGSRRLVRSRTQAPSRPAPTLGLCAGETTCLTDIIDDPFQIVHSLIDDLRKQHLLREEDDPWRRRRGSCRRRPKHAGRPRAVRPRGQSDRCGPRSHCRARAARTAHDGARVSSTVRDADRSRSDEGCQRRGETRARVTPTPLGLSQRDPSSRDAREPIPIAIVRLAGIFTDGLKTTSAPPLIARFRSVRLLRRGPSRRAWSPSLEQRLTGASLPSAVDRLVSS
jgi:hypothetical protein